LGVRYVSKPEELKEPDLIILPGTKSTMHDLRLIRENGLEAEIHKKHAAGIPVLGVCGGYQMLGRTLADPEHAESDDGPDRMRGMGLLPVDTVFLPKKTRTRFRAEIQDGPFAGVHLDGYEIHMGESHVKGDPFCILENGQPDGCTVPGGKSGGDVFGTYLHGLFDTGELTLCLASYLAERKGISVDDLKPLSHSAYVQQQYDKLADGMRSTLNMKAVYAAIGLKE
jgi:adenosylcobyric acid synthase